MGFTQTQSRLTLSLLETRYIWILASMKTPCNMSGPSHRWNLVEKLPLQLPSWRRPVASTRAPSMLDPKISPDRHFTIKQIPYQTRSDDLNTAGVLGNNTINVKNGVMSMRCSWWTEHAQFYYGQFLSCYISFLLVVMCKLSRVSKGIPG